MKTFTTAVLSLALVAPAGVAYADAPSDAARASVVRSAVEVPSSCTSPLQVADRYNTDVASLAETGTITFGGKRIQVAGPGADYRYNDRDKRTWNLWFRSWVWLAAAARQGALEEAVDIAVAWHRAVPDPGASTDKETLAAFGWNEGSVTNRMTVVRCLWNASGDERLRAVMDDLAAANMDEDRYYGRPQRRPHNHGAMANFELLRSGQAFDRPEWVTIALDRLAVDFPEVYSKCGGDREQSSSYMEHNLQLWERAAKEGTNAGRDSLSAAIEKTLESVTQGLRALTMPDGRLVMVGDGVAKEGLAAASGDPLTWWCPESGWAAGRDSWRDTSVHYSVHFGAAAAAHGHDDHGSVTWWVNVNGPTQVLVDRGNPAKDSSAANTAWAESKAAHNVTYPEGVSFLSRSTGTRNLSAKSHGYTVNDQVMRLALKRQRSLNISMADAKLTATDSVSSRDVYTWVQAWHLHPDWQRYTGDDKDVVAVHPNGSQLIVTCTAQVQGRGTVKVAPKLVKEFDYETSSPRRALAVTCSADGSNLKIVGRLQVK